MTCMRTTERERKTDLIELSEAIETGEGCQVDLDSMSKRKMGCCPLSQSLHELKMRRIFWPS